MRRLEKTAGGIRQERALATEHASARLHSRRRRGDRAFLNVMWVDARLWKDSRKRGVDHGRAEVVLVQEDSRSRELGRLNPCQGIRIRRPLGVETELQVGDC